MKRRVKVVTVGLCPSWDTVCRVDGIDWGGHEVVSSREDRPAGKAFNISRALAWLGEENTAAGLWGSADYKQMLAAIHPLRRLVKVKMTVTDGATRQNVTVVDTTKAREMHLRSESGLASKKSLEKLRGDLGKMVNRNRVCVFAGSMPGGRLLSDVVGVVKFCQDCGAATSLRYFTIRRISASSRNVP